MKTCKKPKRKMKTVAAGLPVAVLALSSALPLHPEVHQPLDGKVHASHEDLKLSYGKTQLPGIDRPVTQVTTTAWPVGRSNMQDVAVQIAAYGYATLGAGSYATIVGSGGAMGAPSAILFTNAKT
jgi:hypothetical protein